MHASYQYTPAIWPPILTIILLIALGAYAWRHRDVPGALPFSVGCMLAVLWAFGTVMEYAAVGDSERIVWLKVQGVTQLPCVTAIALFILEYVWPGGWLTRRRILLFSIAPLLLLAMVLTDPLVHLMWRGFYVNGQVLPVRAPLGWALVAYGYLLGLLEMYAFAWLFIRSRLHRWPVAIMLAGFIAARILYLVDQRLDLYAIIIPLITYGTALFAFRILDANVLAREAAIGGMREGMLVLDPARRVASLNASAEAILGLVESEVRGRAIDALVHERPELAAVISAASAGDPEVRLGTGSEALYFQLTHSLLRDFRGLHTGELYLLHDITG
ncbi:MAG: histidine kinase N-terminal 7TM domain-containing protein, partial [Anaerolineae bacterium]